MISMREAEMSFSLYLKLLVDGPSHATDFECNIHLGSFHHLMAESWSN